MSFWVAVLFVSFPDTTRGVVVSTTDIVDISDRDQWLTTAASANGFSSAYLLGDANLDGVVDAQDLNALGHNWSAQPKTWQLGEFNADGIVDAGDLNKIGQHWLVSIPSAAAPKTVPEPPGTALLVFGVLLAGRIVRFEC